MIAEGVTTRAEHERMVRDPDEYRPPFCPNCNGTVLHVHDYRWRKLRAEPGPPEATIVRHACADCNAIWQTLPAFIARHLWRTWAVVERALTGEPEKPEAAAAWPRVPKRTQRRWLGRWRASAQLLLQVLAVCGHQLWAALAAAAGPMSTRHDLVEAYAASIPTKPGARLADVSALVYRLQPKVRLV